MPGPTVKLDERYMFSPALETRNYDLATDSRTMDFPLNGILIDGVAMTASAAELNASSGTGLSAAELAVLDGVTPGTGLASKALILDSGDDIAFPSAGILTVSHVVGNATPMNITGVVGASSVGGTVDIVGGAGNGAGNNGGPIVLTTGAGVNATSGTGDLSGAATVVTGAAGTATTGTAGASGVLSLTTSAGGATTGAAGIGGAGGAVTFTSGTGGACSSATGGVTGVGGAMTIGTGAGGAASGTGASAAGGALILETGAGGAQTLAAPGNDSIVSGASGALTIRTGAGGALTAGNSTAGAGGAIAITGGVGGEAIEDADDTGGAGAAVTLTGGAGGDGQTSGAGGSVSLVTGSAGTQGAGGVTQAGAIFLHSDSVSAPTQPVYTSGAIPQGDAAGVADLVAADIFGPAVYVNTPSGSVDVDFPGGALMVAAAPPGLAVGDCFDFTVINLGSTGQIITMVDQGLTGTVSVVGRADIDPGVAAEGSGAGTFRMRYFGTNAWTAYRIA